MVIRQGLKFKRCLDIVGRVQLLRQRVETQGSGTSGGGHICNDGGPGAGAADNHGEHGTFSNGAGLSGKQTGLLCF